jgi:AcrR family transcriptional regulator
MTIGTTVIPNRSTGSAGKHALESAMREMGGILWSTLTDGRPYGTIQDVARLLARERLSIGEVVARTGVPAATIHHYRRLGLLPPARKRAANRFLYDQRHVQALRLIRLLRERRHLPLDVIRRVLPDLLGLEQDQAFRPQMWDRALGVHSSRGGRRSPAGRLLEAAVDSFSRRGYADVNVDDICRAARIAKGSFYRHYRSKEELFFAAADAAAAEILESFASAAASPVGSLAPDRAAEILARALEPKLPLFMELFTRATQRRPGYPGAARRTFTRLAEQIGALQHEENSLLAGALILQQAAVLVFRRALEPSPLAGLGLETSAPPA